MIMGTMILIHKNMKQSLCNPSNFRAIDLSSILSKILDWVILIKRKVHYAPHTYNLGLKKGLQRSALIVC